MEGDGNSKDLGVGESPLSLEVEHRGQYRQELFDEWMLSKILAKSLH